MNVFLPGWDRSAFLGTKDICVTRRLGLRERVRAWFGWRAGPPLTTWYRWKERILECSGRDWAMHVVADRVDDGFRCWWASMVHWQPPHEQVPVDDAARLWLIGQLARRSEAFGDMLYVGGCEGLPALHPMLRQIRQGLLDLPSPVWPTRPLTERSSTLTPHPTTVRAVWEPRGSGTRLDPDGPATLTLNARAETHATVVGWGPSAPPPTGIAPRRLMESVWGGRTTRSGPISRRKLNRAMNVQG